MKIPHHFSFTTLTKKKTNCTTHTRANPVLGSLKFDSKFCKNIYDSLS